MKTSWSFNLIHCDIAIAGVKTPLKDKQSPPQNQSSSNAKPKQILGNPAHTTYAKAAAGSVENGISFMRISSPTQQQNASVDLGTSPLATFIASNNLTHLKAAQPADLKEIESQRQQGDAQLQALLKKPVPVSAPKANNVGPVPPNNSSSGKPAAKLMPPTMFETTANESNNQRTGPTNANVKAGKNENNEANKKNSTPKGKEAVNQKSRKKSAHEPQAQQNDGLTAAVQPLTETQLLQAISYLMKNDPSFIRKIHEAYLKSFAEMVSQ